MNYSEWFPERLVQLRQEKGVSARDMSLSLGQCESYINKIENRRAMPSMSGFFYICEYFKIEPAAFFDPDNSSPVKANELLNELTALPPDSLELVLKLVKKLQTPRNR